MKPGLRILMANSANFSFVMLGLVPSICLRSMWQQILGTRPRMTPGGEQVLSIKPVLGWPGAFY
ncbi:hypothetical protein CPT32_14915 [Rhizobium sophoriradicis]|nr:hypothetical protein CPT32_14915 [Rhizobium sophoriradicis]